MTCPTLSDRAACARAEALHKLLLEIGPSRSSREIAKELTRRGVQTKRGGRWHPGSVLRLLRHAGFVPGLELQSGILRQLSPGSISVCITSPPYVEQRLKQYGGIPEEDYPAWTVKWLAEIEPALKKGGNVAIILRSFIKNGQVSGYIRETVTKARDAGWLEPGELIRYVPDAMPAGHLHRPRQAFDTILWLSNSTHPYCDPRANGTPSDKIGLTGRKGQGDWLRAANTYRSGIARCTNVAIVANAGCHREPWNHHPAQHPQALME